MQMVEELFSHLVNWQVIVHVAASTRTWVFSDVVWTDDDISVKMPKIISGFKGVGEYFWD